MKRKRLETPTYTRETPCGKCGGNQFFIRRRWACQGCNKLRGLNAYRIKIGEPTLPSLPKDSNQLVSDFLRKKF